MRRRFLFLFQTMNRRLKQSQKNKTSIEEKKNDTI